MVRNDLDTPWWEDYDYYGDQSTGGAPPQAYDPGEPAAADPVPAPYVAPFDGHEQPTSYDGPFAYPPPPTNTPQPLIGAGGYVGPDAWRWTLQTPPQAARPGHEWVWGGAWDQNGQGWQERPRAGWSDPAANAIANTTSDTNQFGLNWWQAQGYDANKIFDLNTGQLRPGWRRTAQGYMLDGWNGGGTGGTDTGGPGGPRPTFNPIPFNPSGGPRANFGSVPEFNPPTFTPPPNFNYTGQTPGQFQAPTAAAMANEPGFQFRLDQGRKALEQSAAAKGTLRSGGTLQNVLNYGQNFASNEYSNVYNRAASEHDRAFKEYEFDYDKQADTYTTNYGVKRDTYDREFQAAKDAFAPRLRGWEVNSAADQRAAELRFQREWDQYVFGEEMRYKKEFNIFNGPQ